MDTTFATAVHVLILLDTPRGRGMRADPIARSVGTHPVRIRQILARLAAAGLTTTVRGRAGGSYVNRPLTAITLADVYIAVVPETSTLIPLHPAPDRRCPVGRGISVALLAPLADVDAAVLETLRAIPVSQVARATQQHQAPRRAALDGSGSDGVSNW